MPMTRVDVLKHVILAASNHLQRGIVVFEAGDEETRLLTPQTGLLVTVARVNHEDIERVHDGARVVVLHTQHATVLSRQIVSLLDRGVGYIVIPNTCPSEEAHQIHPRGGGVWTGDGWKAVAALRYSTFACCGRRRIFTVPSDHGVSVICAEDAGVEDRQTGPLPTLDWPGFLANRDEWLGIVNGVEAHPKNGLVTWTLLPYEVKDVARMVNVVQPTETVITMEAPATPAKPKRTRKVRQ